VGDRRRGPVGIPRGAPGEDRGDVRENLTFAVAGKGGVGKTTISALLVGALRARGEGPVLAVDADPNSCLGELLGLPVERTLGEIRDEVLAQKDRATPGVGKAETVEFLAHRCVAEGRGFDLVVMGRTEGPGCYCYVNNLLRGFMGGLEPNYRFTVMDNEAGLEHLSRRTARKVDHLLVVADASLGSLKAAERVARMAGELGIRPRSSNLVWNRGGGPNRPLPGGLRLAGIVPEDPEVLRAESEGRPLLELPPASPAAAAVAAIAALLVDERDPGGR
jgi:CO dehydrogenase maturation factor